MLKSRSYIWMAALLCGGAFLTAAAITTDPFASLLAAIALALLIAIYAFHRAGRLAARDFFAGFAQSHGFTYTESIELVEATPLLGAGNRRGCRHYMEGALSSELPNVHAGLAHYTYESRAERSGRRGRVVEAWTPHKLTICVANLERAIETFPGIFLASRRGLLGRLTADTWLDYDQLKEVELESSDIAAKYELVVRKNQDRQPLLELFEPSFQVWIANLPFDLFFEFSGGTLVTYVYKHEKDPVRLEIMLQATASIAQRIVREGDPLHTV